MFQRMKLQSGLKQNRHIWTLKQKTQMIFFVSLILIAIFGIAYYGISADILQRREAQSLLNITQQVIGKITTTTDNMERYAAQISGSEYTQRYLQSSSPELRWEYAKVLADLVPSLTQNSNDANNVALVEADGGVTGFPRKRYAVIEALGKEYGAFSPDNIDDGYTDMIYDVGSKRSYCAYYAPIINNREASKLGTKLGTCVVMSALTELTDAVRQINITPHSVFMLVDGKNQIIASNSSDSSSIQNLISNMDKQFASSEAVKTTQNVLGRRSIVQCSYVPKTDWKMISIIPISEINNELTPLFLCSILLFILVTSLFIAWSFRIDAEMTRPILEMAEFMNKGAYHNLHNRLNVKKQNEIGQLSLHINEMLDEIDVMTKTVVNTQSNMYELELSKKQAEISALQSQINPHFLYNTLDCIKGYGYLLNSKEIVEITNALSAIMRYCIKGPETVMVEQELSCVEKYLRIISIRFDGKISSEIDISEELLQQKIPRFLLQPIVENAIYHGIEQKPGGGKLLIRGLMDKGTLIFEISDNGLGIKEEILHKLKYELAAAASEKSFFATSSERSVGLYNVNSRIKFLCGKEYGIEVESRENEGTLVRLRLKAFD